MIISSNFEINEVGVAQVARVLDCESRSAGASPVAYPRGR